MSEKVGGPKKVSLRKRVGSVAAAVGIAGVGFLGVDKGANLVQAAGENTPTPATTPTRTPTPLPDLDAQLATARATATALAEQAPKQKELKELRDQISALQGTPTAAPSSAEVAATAEKTRLEALGKRQAEIKATATAEAAPTATPIPMPTFAPTPAAGAGGKGNEGGPPWGWIIGLPVIGGAAILFGKRIARGARSVGPTYFPTFTRLYTGIRSRLGRTPPPGGTGSP